MRHLEELLRVYFAEQPRTPAEEKRLGAHFRRTRRLQDQVLRDGTIDQWFDELDNGRRSPWEVLWRYRKVIDALPLHERKLPVLLLYLAWEQFEEVTLFTSRRAGEWHRQRLRESHRRGGLASGRTRREHAQEVLKDITEIRAGDPKMSLSRAARTYLMRFKQNWLMWTDVEKERKVMAVVRQVHRATARRKARR